MKLSSKLALFAVFLIMSGLLFGFYRKNTASNSEQSAETNQVESIKIGYMPFTTNWPIFVAVKENIFQKYGLNVELISFSSGVDAANAVISNQVSAHAINTFVDLFNVESRSPGKIKLFALQQLDKDNYSEALIAKNDSGIETVEDLKGKKIGITPGAFTETIIKEAYGNKIDFAKDVELIRLAPNLQLSSLENGQIDALFSYEPNVTQAVEKKIGYVVEEHFFKYVAEPFYLGGFTISQDTINTNPELARKIVNAIDEAIELGNTNPDIKFNAISAYTSIDIEIVKKLRYSNNLKNSQIDVESAAETANLYKSLGLYEGEIDAKSMIFKLSNE